MNPLQLLSYLDLDSILTHKISLPCYKYEHLIILPLPIMQAAHFQLWVSVIQRQCSTLSIPVPHSSSPDLEPLPLPNVPSPSAPTLVMLMTMVRSISVAADHMLENLRQDLLSYSCRK